jgi:sirohydrochlorin cobaltochelatase
MTVTISPELGADPRIVDLVIERYDEARRGEARMNCDLCIYRAPLPGYESRVGAPLPVHAHHHHD